MIEAVLLLGATGAGKTPLGEYLDRVGWSGRRCRHFDFGAHLRAVAEGRLRPRGLSDDDVAVVGRALAAGVLLEDHEFPIAAAILLDFLARRSVSEEELVVLNGLPRHVGQAEGIEGIVRMRTVIHLDARPATLRERIRRNTGGDREGRGDDTEAAILARVERFRARTRPLLERYAGRVRTVWVGVETTPADVLAALEGA